MSIPEILAPAGSEEALRAAVRCGAGAVYLGLERYGARAHAQNFTIDTLRGAVRYCHSRGVLLYVTLNTLLRDDELPEFARTVRDLCAESIDAVIVQDLGAARLIRGIAPDLPMHASTQMSVQSLAGLYKLAERGFVRAVLPRELSREELAAIIPAAPVECEVFVHGALCSSLSGQCLMSAFFGGRSANRGDCAQPCRLAFRRPNDVGEVHALSLKDLCLLDSLPELARMGAASFKIEGRMKRPEYVAAAVTACRQALDGGIDTALRGNLEDVFSRSGFTRGYYDAQRGRGMEGFRRREDVSAAKGALPSLAALYAKELPRFAVDFALTAQVGELPVLSAELAGCGVRVTVRGESAVAQSLCGGTDATRVREQLGKCGGTQFYLSVCELQLQEGAQMPISALNALRREALARLETELLRREALRCDEYMQPKISAHIAKAATLHIRVADAEQIPADLRGVSRVILPLTQSLPANLPSYVTPAVEIPRGIFGNEESVLRELRRAKSAGFASAVAGGLDGAALAMSARLPFSAGFGSNICNTQSLEEWSELGAADALISPEMQPYRAAKLGGELPRSLFAYGRLPLMLLRRCPHRGAEGCADCSAAKKPFLIDRMGKNFPLQCRGREYSEVLACNPVYLADRRRELRFADALLLYFTDESPKECAKILTAFREGTPPVGDYTRGLIDFRL